MQKLLVMIFLIFVCSINFGLAQAHPFIVNTEPAQASNVSTGINQIVIYYSETVEQDYSTIKVFDKNGNQVDNKDTKYFQGENSLVVTTEPLDDGVYTVTSKVLSKVDGHIVDSAFVFAIGSARIDPSLLEKKNRTTFCLCSRGNSQISRSCRTGNGSWCYTLITADLEVN